MVLLDRVRAQLTVVERTRGIERVVCAENLRGFWPKAWNCLRVTLRGGRLIARLDGVPVADVRVNGRSGRVGLVDVSGCASFAGFAATHAYETCFEAEDNIADCFEARYGGYKDARIRLLPGEVRPSRNSDGCALMYREKLPESFRLSLHMALLRPDGEMLGALMEDDGGDQLRCLVRPKEKAAVVVLTRGGREETLARLPLDDQALSGGITFHVEQRGENVRVLLNRGLLYEGSPGFIAARAGFCSRQCECSWRSFSVTGLS